MDMVNNPYADRKPTVPTVGDIFGQWKFVAADSSSRWTLECSCGTIRSVIASDIRSHKSSSCGCISGKGLGGVKNRTHGVGYESKVYRTWRNIKNRCYNPNAEKYLAYGARGIVMDDMWKDSFVDFYNYIGEPPSAAHTVERIDNNLGYILGNVKWATLKEQSQNKQDTIRLTVNGVTKTLVEWSSDIKIADKTLRARLASGWSAEDTILLPKGYRHANHTK